MEPGRKEACSSVDVLGKEELEEPGDGFGCPDAAMDKRSSGKIGRDRKERERKGIRKREMEMSHIRIKGLLPN